jgi:hypothetical protein
MNNMKTIIASILTVASVAAHADLLTSRPSDSAVLMATSQCTRTTEVVPLKPTGLSDPHFEDLKVRQFAKDLGAKWVRLNIHATVVMANGTPDFSGFDSQVADLKAKGINILITLNEMPATMVNEWPDLATWWGTYVSATVAHYAPMGIHHWEVFNEPNLPGYGWLTPGLNGADFMSSYVWMLAKTNVQIRANDPKAVVIMGGMSPDGASGEKVWELQGHNCFDVFAYHPYDLGAGQWAAKVQTFRSAFAYYGDTAKPIWFNEYGANQDVNRTTKINDSFNQRSAVDGFFWFGIRDWTTNPNERFGVYTTTNAKKTTLGNPWQTLKNRLATAP